jgi:SEC-C motif-containing protein
VTGIDVEGCVCGAGRSYDACCGRLHRGSADARTAVELMRSRYSAFVLCDGDYLLATWHPQQRPARMVFPPGQRWTALVIHSTEAGGLFDTAGTVEFTATCEVRGVARQLHETSRFARLDGRWVYVAADHS